MGDRIPGFDHVRCVKTFETLKKELKFEHIWILLISQELLSEHIQEITVSADAKEEEDETYLLLT